jgi:acyl transferase domain-containing protein
LQKYDDDFLISGDPIEMYAVGQAYSEGRTEPLLVGSVKTNIGHCESAAGIASLIKVILCLEHGSIPPHLHLKNLNPRINLESIPASIPMELTPWKAARKIAAISSFSMSATNVHVIVQEPPKPRSNQGVRGGGQEMITISAKTEDALKVLVQRYIAWLQENPKSSLQDIAYASNTGRAHLQHRIAVVSSNAVELTSRLEKRRNEGRVSVYRTRLTVHWNGKGTRGSISSVPKGVGNL